MTVDRAEAEALDAADPLAGWRDEFVIADPDRRDAAHTRLAHHVTWGPGGVRLSGGLPWEGQA